MRYNIQNICLICWDFTYILNICIRIQVYPVLQFVSPQRRTVIPDITSWFALKIQFLCGEMQDITECQQFIRSCSEAEWNPRERVTFPPLSFLCGRAVSEEAAAAWKETLTSREMLTSPYQDTSSPPHKLAFHHFHTQRNTHLCLHIGSHQIQGLVECCAALPICECTDQSES